MVATAFDQTYVNTDSWDPMGKNYSCLRARDSDPHLLSASILTDAPDHSLLTVVVFENPGPPNDSGVSGDAPSWEGSARNHSSGAGKLRPALHLIFLVTRAVD